jgi:lysophospholipase L1-like esterase
MMKIAFLGDSITYGYGLEDKSLRYATLVAKDLNATEENYGITGTLMAKAGPNREGEKESGRDFLVRLPNIDAADAAVIFGGTNDYFWSDRPIMPPAGECAPEYFFCALHKICKRIKEVRGDKPTLFVTPYPHHGIGNFVGGEHFKDKSEHDTTEVNFNGQVIADYVDTLNKVCGEYGIPVLDLHRTEGFDWRTMTSDGCHPNPVGHKWLADKVTAAIEKLIG